MPGTTVPLCNGPYGNSTVLPVLIQGPALPTYGNFNTTASSLCNVPFTNSLWFWNNQVVYAQQTTAAVTALSWLTVQTNAYPSGGLLTGHVFTPPVARPKRIVPAVIRAGRRALRRSIDIYASFRGMDEIRRFIHGETISFDGVLFRYRIKRHPRGSILAETMNPSSSHIPYSLTLVNKETDEGYGTGCIVFAGLPVIDQILALFFQTQIEEEERKLLVTVNWAFDTGLSPLLSSLRFQRLERLARTAQNPSRSRQRAVAHQQRMLENAA